MNFRERNQTKRVLSKISKEKVRIPCIKLVTFSKCRYSLKQIKIEIYKLQTFKSKDLKQIQAIKCHQSLAKVANICYSAPQVKRTYKLNSQILQPPKMTPNLTDKPQSPF